jgi:RND family efflux transporter MFP subunit
MKKIIIPLAMVLALVSCKKEQSETEIRKQINEHKQEIKEIENEISSLQEKLKNRDTEQENQFKIPVFVKKLAPENFSHFIKANGSVEARNEAFISPETNGQIKTIHVEEGDKVKKGQLLVSLSTSVIRSNIKEVKTNLELARETYEKQKRLWEEEVGSEMQYLQAKNNKESLESRLETLKEQLEMARIKAPYSGIIEKIFQKEGEMGSPGVQIIHLVNMTKLRVNAEISEEYLRNINEGDELEISFPSYPEMKLEVPITRKGSVIDKESRTFIVEADINNYDRKIKPNQIAVVKVRDFSTDSALVVPSNIIKQDMKGDYVYIVKEKNGNSVAKKVYVKPGRSYNNKTVISGIQKGQRVITAGYTKVSNGMEVAVKEKEKVTG